MLMNTKMPGGYMCGADCTENAKQLQLIFYLLMTSVVLYTWVELFVLRMLIF